VFLAFVLLLVRLLFFECSLYLLVLSQFIRVKGLRHSLLTLPNHPHMHYITLFPRYHSSPDISHYLSLSGTEHSIIVSFICEERRDRTICSKVLLLFQTPKQFGSTRPDFVVKRQSLS
jgi:hypothetical protein